MSKIAHFIDSEDMGGAETLIIELCLEYRERGYSSEVLHVGNKWLIDKCEKHGIKERIIPGVRYYKSILTLPIFILLFSLFLRREKLEILHSHLFDAVFAGGLAAWMAGSRHVGTLHDIYSIRGQRLKIAALKLLSLLGTRIVSVSHEIRDYLISFGVFTHSQVNIVTNGIDLSRFKSPDRVVSRAKLGIPMSDVVYICVARIVPIKGVDILIEVAEKFSKLDRAFKLVIAGDGDDMLHLQDISNSKCLSDKVVFLGERDDIPELLAMSDCFVLASRSEGLSCSIIEALAAELPIIATKVGDNSFLVEEGRNGYLVDVDSIEQFVGRMDELYRSRDTRQQFANHSAGLARNLFSIERAADSYIDIYNII